MKLAFSIFASSVLFVSAASAQTPARVPPINGSVTAVNAAANQITIKTPSGESVDLVITANSHLLHLPLGETDMKKAVKLTIGDVTPGERLVASYQLGSDQKTKEARTLLIQTKEDLDELAKKEDEDWRKRGTTGNLASVDAAAKTFTLKSGSREITVKPTEKTEYLEYSPDSASIGDAKPSAFTALKAGDEIHVLGDKSADGTSITGEKVVFGYFPQIAATIKSVNAAGNEIVVTDLATKKPVTIRVVHDSIMKKLPDTAAQALARRYGAARGGAAGGDAGGGRGRGAGGPGGPGGPGGGRGGDPSQMLEHAPAITLADLKAGDAIMVKTTAGKGPGSGTAVMLIAGVEPILTAAPNATRDIMSGWNLGGGGGEGN